MHLYFFIIWHQEFSHYMFYFQFWMIYKLEEKSRKLCIYPHYWFCVGMDNYVFLCQSRGGPPQHLGGWSQKKSTKNIIIRSPPPPPPLYFMTRHLLVYLALVFMLLSWSDLSTVRHFEYLAWFSELWARYNCLLLKIKQKH